MVRMKKNFCTKNKKKCVTAKAPFYSIHPAKMPITTQVHRYLVCCSYSATFWKPNISIKLPLASHEPVKRDFINTFTHVHTQINNELYTHNWNRDDNPVFRPNTRTWQTTKEHLLISLDLLSSRPCSLKFLPGGLLSCYYSNFYI